MIVDWKNIQRVHCVGVGGIGLSALARLLAAQGKEVSGCDRDISRVTDGLADEEVGIFLGHSAEHVSAGTGLLIYSDAIPEDNIERARARELGIPELSYFQALGSDANRYKVIAVAGTHGKTSTTAMMADVFEAAGLDPSSVVGSLRTKTKSNYHAGKGEYFIVEADEYLRHFLEFSPYIAVITNIDADHLDYYKDLSDIQSAFRALVEKIPASGYVVCEPYHPNVAPVVAGLACTVVDYKKFFDPSLPLKALPLHRINAAAVLAVADILKISPSTSQRALGEFSGTWRRFEYKGKTGKGADVYDDYGHHPTEVATTLASVREKFPSRRIVVAFHPHLYSRTKILMEEFAGAFSAADEVVLAPIFAAREAPDPTVSSEILASKIIQHGIPARALGSFEEIETYLRENTKLSDVIVTMGAGDIYKVGEALLDAV